MGGWGPGCGPHHELAKIESNPARRLMKPVKVRGVGRGYPGG